MAETALLHALRRRWLPAFGLGLIAAVLAAGVVWQVMPPRYTAQALLHVAQRRPPGIITPYETVDDFAAYQRTQAALLKSRLVLNTALRQPQVAELPEVRNQIDPVTWLAKSLQVDSTLGPEILRVSFGGDRPQELALLVNAVVDAYLQEIVHKELTKHRARMGQLEENYRRFEETLRNRRRTLRELEEALGADASQTALSKHQAGLQQLAAAEKEVLQVRLDLKKTEVELAAQQERMKAPPSVLVSETAIDEYLRQDPVYLSYQARLAKLQEEINITQAIAQGAARSRELDRLTNLQSSAEKQMADRRAHVRPTIEAHLRTRAQDESRAMVTKLQDRLALLREQGKVLEGEVSRLRGTLKEPGKKMSDLEALRTEVAQAEALVKKVGDQLDTLKLDPPPPPRVSLIESAEVPQTRSIDRPLKFAGVSGMGAFALLVVGVTWRELRARRIYTPEDVNRGLGLPVLGTLPALPVRARRALPQGGGLRDAYWQNLLAESVDTLRTQLLHAAQADDLQLVMVTSALGGEGKTSLATHLAVSLARAWRKTLLIDGDLRNPAVHRQFDLPVKPGLCEVLRGEVEFEDVIQPTPVSRLWMVSAGQWDSHAVQALAQEGVRPLFERLKDEYEFIVLDSSPVLPVADSLSLGQNVDAVILTVLQDVSRLPAVQAAQQRLAALGIRLLGSVVLGTSADRSTLAYNARNQTRTTDQHPVS